MRKIQKKRARKKLGFLLIILMLINEIPLYTRAEEQQGKEEAVFWLQKAAKTGQEWENHGLPNLTCDVMAVLREEGEETDSNYLKEWERSKKTRNLDEQVHLAWAWGNRKDLDIVWGWQNPDGGFGLTKDYTSDVYDTLLVLLAESAVKGKDGLTEKEELKSNSDAVLAAADYLAKQQRADGGFGYSKADEAVPGLSAEVGIALLSLNIENDELYEKLDQYCCKAFVGDFSEKNFYVQAELARYLYRRDKIENADHVETELYMVQKENGSVYNSVENTIQYILLLNKIEEYHTLKFEVEGLVTEADTYVLEVDEEQEVALQTTIQYTINQEMTGFVRYILLEDGNIVEKKEQECMFVPNQNMQIVESIIRPVAEEGKEYILRTEVILKDSEGNDTAWEKEEFKFTLHKGVENELVLQAETFQAEDYGINLSWNDISNDDERYGYRIFRKKENGDWETRSTWDGEEKVRVLNIYPCNEAQNYLVDWMEDTVSDSEEPAGKGLFEINTVNIYDFNRTPDRYLMDEEGNYLYDVLVFGTYDSNAFADLSEQAYDATQKYLDSGRGALFGHDTVAEYYGNHKTMFPKFGERLGMKLIRDGYLQGSDKVKVVKSGILTNYPWKLTGTLTIPASHVAGQYAGGSLPSTVWMEFQNDCLTDEETGAKNNAYLLSRNSMAVIQTGHSNGQATDDERKILANTLFYLKQWTDKTSASDQSFYDEAPPEITSVSDASSDKQIIIQGKDNGTPYQYYTEAVHAGKREAETKKSNIVKVQAVSGIRGFIVGMGDSEETLEEVLEYDEEGNLISKIFPAVNGSLVYTIDGLETGESTYLHMYAVDYANNVSKERVCQVTIPEKRTEETRTSEEKPEVSEKETETSEEKPEVSEKETQTSEEKPEVSEKETETSEEKPEISEKETETPGEKLEVSEKETETSEEIPEVSEKVTETFEKETKIPEEKWEQSEKETGIFEEELEEKTEISTEETATLEEKQKLLETEPKLVEKEYFHSPYAMFTSGNSTVIRCQKAKIKGSIYTGKLFAFRGRSFLLKGSVFGTRRLSIDGRKIALKKKVIIPKGFPLPDYNETILQDMKKEYGKIEKQKICTSIRKGNPYRCEKADVSGCSQVNITEGLVSDEMVWLHAPIICCGKEKPVVLCSQNGDISIEALRFNGNGLIYAPNGTVTIRASEVNYTGTILAKKIRIQADCIKINQQGEHAYDK